MKYFRGSRFFRSVVLPLTLVVWLSACAKEFVAIPSPYEQTLASEEPTNVMVTLDDGNRIHVRHPRIEAGSLIGLVYDARERAYTDTLRVALTDVTLVEKRKAVPTWVWVLTGVAAVGITVWAISFSKHCNENPGTFLCD